MKRAIPFFIIITCIVFNTFSQPFGIHFGMNLEELKTVATIEKEVWKGNFLISPIKKTIYLQTYYALISPTYGVFSITALGKDINSDGYGTEIKSEVEKVVKLVSEVYGEPDLIRNLPKKSSVFDEPNDWLKSIREGNREYQYIWYIDLPYNMEWISISIMFKNTSSNMCYLVFNCTSLDREKGIEELQAENPF